MLTDLAKKVWGNINPRFGVGLLLLTFWILGMLLPVDIIRVHLGDEVYEIQGTLLLFPKDAEDFVPQEMRWWWLAAGVLWLPYILTGEPLFLLLCAVAQGISWAICIITHPKFGGSDVLPPGYVSVFVFSVVSTVASCYYAWGLKVRDLIPHRLERLFRWLSDALKHREFRPRQGR